MRIELSVPIETAALLKRLGHVAGGKPPEYIRAVCTDSRRVQPGDLYIALRGEKDDGHRYLAKAQAGGASFLLSEREFPGALRVKSTREALGALATISLEARRPRVIGITGSVGKTTAKEYMAAVLSADYRVHRTNENENNEIGLPKTILTRPADCEILIAEFGTNHPGEIAAHTALCRPDIAVITLIGQAHLGAFGSREAIFAEKTAILSASPTPLALLNRDDDLLSGIRLSGSVGVALHAPADITAADIRVGADFVTFTAKGDGFTEECTLSGSGKERIYAALFALGVGRIFGVSLSDAVRALKKAVPPKSRQQIINGSSCTLIDDAYNASPESVRAALELLSALAGSRRRIAILGDMLELGDRTESLHEDAGRSAAGFADRLFAFGEMAHAYAAGAILGGMRKEAVMTFDDPESCAEAVCGSIIPRDILLVKSSHAAGGYKITEKLTDFLSGHTRPETIPPQ